MGVTEAVLKLVGTVPDCREELMMLVMIGARVGRQAFTSVVGMGSREQLEALALVTSSVVRDSSTGEKEVNRGHVAEGAVSCS